MILLIDNYDSFTYNLDRYLRRLGSMVEVVRNDQPQLDSLLAECAGIVLSPGPCGPLQAGRCIEVVQRLSGIKPILGICLGHQVIGQAFGGDIVRASRPIHGQAFAMELTPSELFEGIPNRSKFARYHSLVIDSQRLPSCLTAIAHCDTPSTSSQLPTAREIMAVEHRQHPTYGVQFHPESILSDAGYRLLANFLTVCHQPSVEPLPGLDLTDVRQRTCQLETLELEHTAVLPQY
jgi:anthranilate synthase/aminodeoxychorismate synthase-like glutamine amidotransferase